MQTLAKLSHLSTSQWGIPMYSATKPGKTSWTRRPVGPFFSFRRDTLVLNTRSRWRQSPANMHLPCRPRVCLYTQEYPWKGFQDTSHRIPVVLLQNPSHSSPASSVGPVWEYKALTEPLHLRPSDRASQWTCCEARYQIACVQTKEGFYGVCSLRLLPRKC